MVASTCMPTRPVFLLVILIFALIFSACGSAPSQGTPSVDVTSSVSQISLPTQAKIPAPTSILIPQDTALPTTTKALPFTAEPTLDPGLPSSEPPEVSAGPILSPENAGIVIELAGWGDGYDFDLTTIQKSQVVSGGQVLVAFESLPNVPDFADAIRTRFWELPSGQLRLDMIHPLGYNQLFVSPDASHIATNRGLCPSDMEKCVFDVWYVPTDERLLSLELGFLETAVFSQDNHWIALAAGEEIQIWALDTARMVHSLPQSYRFDRFRFSNDGELLAGYQRMTENGRVWQVETGEALKTLASEVYTGAYFPSDIAFSPDDTQLAIIFNSMVELWRVSDWSEGLAWIGHDSFITKVTFSPDGRLIASGAEDGSIVLFDAATGEVLARLVGHSYSVSELAFSADGKLLISTALDGTLRFWGIAGE